MEVSQRKCVSQNESETKVDKAKKKKPGFKRNVYIVLCLSGIFFLCLSFYIHNYLFKTVHISNIDFLNAKQCPACFGQSLCPTFFRGEIDIRGLMRFPMLHFYNPRNVFHGYMGLYHRTQPVVIKKLAMNSEIDSVDSNICSEVKRTWPKCIPRASIYKLLSDDSNIPLLLKDIARLNQPLYCPTQRLKDRIVNRFKERVHPDSDSQLLRHDELVLLYSLRVNMQSVMMQMFPSHEGWPFPRYRGACGRWIVEDYEGDPISSFCHYHIDFRLEVALRLLYIARRLTNSKDDYALYMGDVQMENFVVMPKTRKVTLVDLEHLLIVDKKELKMHPKSDTSYVGNFSKCSSYNETNHRCPPQFPRDQLCSYVRSDYNYMAICQAILSPTFARDQDPDCPQGFLSDLPANYPELAKQLDECAKPSQKGISRDILIPKLIESLQKIVFQQTGRTVPPLSDESGSRYSA